ncbi:unnamed protein product [Chrysoparadoxa australica]
MLDMWHLPYELKASRVRQERQQLCEQLQLEREEKRVNENLALMDQEKQKMKEQKQELEPEPERERERERLPKQSQAQSLQPKKDKAARISSSSPKPTKSSTDNNVQGVYPNPLKLKPCADCKSKRHDGIYCRLQMSHYRKPDFDAAEVAGGCVAGWDPPAGFPAWLTHEGQAILESIAAGTGSAKDGSVVDGDSNDELVGGEVDRKSGVSQDHHRPARSKATASQRKLSDDDFDALVKKMNGVAVTVSDEDRQDRTPPSGYFDPITQIKWITGSPDGTSRMSPTGQLLGVTVLLGMRWLAPSHRKQLPHSLAREAARRGGHKPISGYGYFGSQTSEDAKIPFKHQWQRQVLNCKTAAQLAVHLKVLEHCIDFEGCELPSSSRSAHQVIVKSQRFHREMGMAEYQIEEVIKLPGGKAEKRTRWLLEDDVKLCFLLEWISSSEQARAKAYHAQVKMRKKKARSQATEVNSEVARANEAKMREQQCEKLDQDRALEREKFSKVISSLLYEAAESGSQVLNEAVVTQHRHKCLEALTINYLKNKLLYQMPTESPIPSWEQLKDESIKICWPLVTDTEALVYDTFTKRYLSDWHCKKAEKFLLQKVDQGVAARKLAQKKAREEKQLKEKLKRQERLEQQQQHRPKQAPHAALPAPKSQADELLNEEKFI